MSGKKAVSGFGVQVYEIEGIPFRRFDSLLQREVEWFESRSDSRIRSIRDILELAKKISKDTGLSEDEALEKVQDLENPENKNLLMLYAEQLDEIKANSYTETHFKRDVAVMVLNSRVPKKWLKDNVNLFSEAFDLELDSEEPEFTSEKAELLPTKLINAICEFCTNEKLEWAEPETPVNQEEAPETLGE